MRNKKRIDEKIVFYPRKFEIYFTDSERSFVIKFFRKGEFCSLEQTYPKTEGKILIRLVTKEGKRYIRPKDMLYILSGNRTLKRRLLYRFERYRKGIEGDGVYVHNLYFADGHYTDQRPKGIAAMSTVYRDTEDRAS